MQDLLFKLGDAMRKTSNKSMRSSKKMKRIKNDFYHFMEIYVLDLN
jgi:hypothetical protein